MDSVNEIISTRDIVGQLKQASLFKPVSEADLEALVALMVRQPVPAGETLFNKGDQGDSMYIILSGKVHIFTRDDQGDLLTFTHYGPGHVFGDFTLLDQQPRSASAVAEEPLDLLVLTRTQFEEILVQHPAVGLAIIRHLTDRLRYMTIYLNKITTFGQKLVEGNFDAAIAELGTNDSGDTEIDGLIAAFMHMVHTVKDREAKLSTQQ